MHAIVNRKMLKKIMDEGKWDDDFIKYIAGNLSLIIDHDAFLITPEQKMLAIQAMESKQALTSDGGDDDNGPDFSM